MGTILIDRDEAIRHLMKELGMSKKDAAKWVREHLRNGGVPSAEFFKFIRETKRRRTQDRILHGPPPSFKKYLSEDSPDEKEDDEPEF